MPSGRPAPGAPLPAAAPVAFSAARRSPGLGVVIPALDEASALPGLLSDISRLAVAHQVAVVDGGSDDDTVAVARTGGALVLRSAAGRARQMNAGAAFLRARWLLFLHADTRLDVAAREAVRQHLARDKPIAAHFGLALAHPHFWYRLLEAGQRVRERLFGLVYGDQGLLVPRALFFQAGAFPDEPVMEDVALNLRLRRAGMLVRLRAVATSSARRYEEEGRVRAFLRNARSISRFMAGTPPSALAPDYPPRRKPMPEAVFAPGTFSARRSFSAPQASPAPARLLVFAKAPRPGAVKTRLAATVGPEAAAEAYRRLGRMVAVQLADAPAEMTVCFDPPDAETDMRRWLDPLPHRYVPQGEGDLGKRMSRMVRVALNGLEGAGRAVVVGTDAPAVDAALVARALKALDSADLVLGPSIDGGYYLVGLKAPCPDLFQSIPWSTCAVLEVTASRARDLGLKVTYLEVKTDVDAATDLTPDLARRLGLAPAPTSALP